MWPLTARRAAGEGLQARAVTVAGLDVRDLAAEFGTPLYVLDEDDFRTRAAAFRAAYDDPALPTDVFYAGKAFLCSTVARWVQDEGLNLAVCSGGELLTASFEVVKNKLYDILGRADVGVIDVSWARKEESGDEQKRLNLEKQREVKQIKDEFREILEDNEPAPAPAPPPNGDPGAAPAGTPAPAGGTR